MLTLASNTAQSLRISLANNGGTLGLGLDAPRQTAWLEATPSIVTAAIAPDATAEVPLQLSELSDHTIGNVIDIQVSDLISPSGRYIAATSITPMTHMVTIPAGGAQTIHLRIERAAVVPDIYRGGITITLSDGTRQLIPLQLDVTDGSTIYLPLIYR